MNCHRNVRLLAVFVLLAVAAAGCRGVRNWLEGEPNSIQEWHSAMELFEDERYEQAGVAFRAWLADYHDSKDVLRPFVIYKLAECHRETRDYERAVRAYEKIIELCSDSPDASVQDLVRLAKLRLDDIRPRTRPWRPPEQQATQDETR